MFERFTRDARAAVTGAQTVARDLGDHHIGTGHVLLAIVRSDGAVARALQAEGLDADDLRTRLARVNAAGGDAIDAEALKSIGIDLDAVREATEAAFGEGALDVPAGKLPRLRGGHIPFTPEAKKALELSLRHAIRLKQKEIRSGHLVLGMLHDDTTVAARLTAGTGVNAGDLRARIERLLTSEAA